MALKVGDLYVAVTASIGEAVTSLAKLAKKVEDTAKKVKEAAEPIGNIGAVVAAGIGGAVVVAAQSNQRLAAEVQHIQEVLYTFAAEVGDLFLPLARRVGDFLSNLVAHFQRMDPRVKQAAASFAAWAAMGALGVGVVGKLAASVEGLAKGFGIVLQGVKATLPVIGKLGPVLNGVGPAATKAWQALQAMKTVDVGATMSKLWMALKGMAPTMEGMKAGLGGLGKAMVDFAKSTPSMLSSVGKMLMSFGAAAIPILAVAAAITAIVLLAGVLYKNWGDIKLIASEAWGAMSESISEMMGGLGELADNLAGFFVEAFDGFGNFVKSLAERALSFVAFLVRGSAKLVKPLVQAARMKETEKALTVLEGTTGESLAAGIAKALEGGATSMAAMTQQLKAAKDELGKSVVATVQDAATAVGKGVSVAKDVAGVGLSDAMKGVKMMLADISSATGMDEMKGRLEQLMSWMNGKSEARIRQPGDLNGDLRQKSYDQLQAYENEAAKREADRAAAADEENAATSLEALANEADRAAEELEGNRDASLEAREEYAASVHAEMEAAHEANLSIWQETQRFADEAKAAMDAARADLISGFLGRMGELGGLIDAAKQGFSAGGWWGALLATIGELVMGSDQMAEAMEVLNGVIGMLKDLFGAAATGLDTIMGGVGYLVSVIVEVVQPSMEAMGEAMESIAPIIVLVGMVLKMLAPALDAIGKATAWLLDNVLKGLFQVLRYVAIVILYVIKGLGSAWNGIVSAIQWVFRKLGDISILGAHPLGFLKGWANSMEGAKVDIESLARSIQELEGLTWDAAMAKARETAEVLKNRDALEDVNEALSNVPDLWKVALRRFEAQDAQDGPNTTPGTQPAPTSGAPSTPAPPTPEVLPPISRGGGGLLGMGGTLQELLDLILGGSNATGAATASAMPPVQYNITGFDLSDAMAQARQDYENRQRKAGVRLFGTSAAVGPRYA
ncbi:hypothetical protein [Corallococcus sp. AS-1-6]|uniref:hypothetical protein n=1 Tax=Corallococcus sp. AS-1-6 TaxID=2874599 RepID=UPI001CBB5728|nr:hypothetical protein [Corallococcus sp. AS-1-6]MBZ4371486.1 hypothetical protein [Corallococcus sp. AS-1-6]